MWLLWGSDFWTFRAVFTDAFCRSTLCTRVFRRVIPYPTYRVTYISLLRFCSFYHGHGPCAGRGTSTHGRVHARRGQKKGRPLCQLRKKSPCDAKCSTHTNNSKRKVSRPRLIFIYPPMPPAKWKPVQVIETVAQLAQSAPPVVAPVATHRARSRAGLAYYQGRRMRRRCRIMWCSRRVGTASTH